MTGRPRALTLPLVDPSLDDVLAWARTAELTDVFLDRATIRWLVGELESEGRCAEVIDVVRRVEFTMARGTRWGTWRTLLEAALRCSLALPDRGAEAWARHQLGTRAMALEDNEVARTQLHLALEAHEAMGNQRGARATRHNLSIMPLALSAMITLLTLLVGVVAVGLPMLEDLPPEKRLLMEIPNEVHDLPSVADGASIVLHNVGTADIEDVAVRSAAGSTADVTLATGCMPLLAPGATCAITLDVSDVEVADLPLVVDVTFTHSDEADNVGDRRLLITRPDESDDAA